MITTIGRGSAALAFLGLLAMGACDDETVAPGLAGLPAEIQALAPGIHPILSIPGLGVAPPAEITRVRLHLYQVGEGDEVASYQGVLRYDPEALEILDGAFASGLLGAWNVVEPGVLRFAGIAPDGLAGVPALDLTVRASRPPMARDFRVEMEEVVGSEGFADLTDKVGREGPPVLTGVALRPAVR